MVDENEILDQLEKGAELTKDIQNFTGAGTSCGRVDGIVSAYKKEKPKPQ